jgi:hypothetical protein
MWKLQGVREVSNGDEQKIMENVKSDKKRKLTKLLVLAWVMAATLGGCVISLNIQNKNNNSKQNVEQSQMATQKNDSTKFKLELNGK